MSNSAPQDLLENFAALSGALTELKQHGVQVSFRLEGREATLSILQDGSPDDWKSILVNSDDQLLDLDSLKLNFPEEDEIAVENALQTLVEEAFEIKNKTAPEIVISGHNLNDSPTIETPGLTSTYCGSDEDPFRFITPVSDGRGGKNFVVRAPESQGLVESSCLQSER